MSIYSDFKKFLARQTKLSEEAEREVLKMAKDAAEVMVGVAKEKTPPRNGEMRGPHTVTGNLSSLWQYDVQKEKNDIVVFLKNNAQYASYVDQGHRLVRHFVPWLYVDKKGVIGRHLPMPGEPVFGLVVGTKKSYIKPYNMTKYATEAFEKAFKNILTKRIKRLENRGNNGKD